MSWLSDFAGKNLGLSNDAQDGISAAAAIAAAAYGGSALMGGTAAGAGGASAAGAGGSSALSQWGPALLGGGLSFLGQQSANQSNIASSREQMMFQERMRATSHQTEVADLKAAGLNPILSANAGSGTPSGASAQSQSSLGAGVASAMEIKNAITAAKRLQLDNELAVENKKLIQAQTHKTKTETRGLETDALKGDIWKSIVDKFKGAVNYNAEKGKKYSLPPSFKQQPIRNGKGY